MKIGIVGWGIEGQSAYRYFGPDNDYLIVNEEARDDFPEESDKIKIQFIDKERLPGLTGNVEDLSYLQGLEQCDKIIYSPVAPKNLHKVYGDNKEFWSKSTSVLHIFFENVKTKNLIGITGTKGKGTTSTLTAKLLETEGNKVYLGGNIGKSVLDFVNEVKETDWVVLELSSFQLYNFPYSPRVAVCLMVAAEHMDWHMDMNEYADSKANLFKHQKSDDIAIYFAENEHSKQIAETSAGKKVPYFTKPGAFVREDGMIVIGDSEKEIISKTEVKLLGEHNLQNICAACTAVFEALGKPDPSGIVHKSGIPQGQPSGTSLENAVGGSTWVDNAKTVLSSFSGLEHRLELVREFESVKYYDDSFGTTPDTAIVAIKAISEPKIVILGGSDKGIPFNALADEVTKNNVKHAIVIGATADKISSLLKQRGFSNITLGLKTMPEIVAEARKHAQPGDAVLLSTGCASFGLFKDYKDRGNQFKKAVHQLT